MDTYRYDRQDSSSFKGIKRVVTAQAGPYTSLQLPVFVGNEQYRSVIDVGLPTSLISTAIWQKVSSPLYPISESEIAERVTRRTNLQLMGYTHFQLQVGQTVLELEDALVYDYDEPEIFLSISAVAALGLVIDFQEGTFGLRSVDGLRCSWNEDTVLFPNNDLGNFSLLNNSKPPAGNYFDYTGSINEGHHTNNMAPFHSSGKIGKMSQEMTGHIPVGINEIAMGIPGIGQISYNEMPPPPPIDLGPMQPPVNMGSLIPYSMTSGHMHMRPVKKQNKPNKQRKHVNLKKFKNFFFKTVKSGSNSKGSAANNKFLKKIANWKNDPSKEKTNKPQSVAIKSSTTPQKPASIKKKDSGNSNTESSPNAQSKLTKNQRRREKKKLQAQISPGSQTNVTAPKTTTNSDNKDNKTQRKIYCVNCHSKDHMMDKCRQPIALKCVYCGLAGHLRTNCPTVMKTSSATDIPESTQTSSVSIPGPKSSQSTATTSVTKSGPVIAVATSSGTQETVLTNLRTEAAVSCSETDTPAVGVKRSTSSPEKVIVKKKVIEDNSDVSACQATAVPVEKATEMTDSASIVEVKNKLPSTSFDSFQAPDDSLKNPELDLVVCEPVKRVVAKKNIKLNMLPKSNPTASQVSKGSLSDSENSLPSVEKDLPMETETGTTAVQEKLVSVTALEVPEDQKPLIVLD